MSQPLLVRQQGPVAILSINDVPMNRMSLEFMDQLEMEVDRIAGDPSTSDRRPYAGSSPQRHARDLAVLDRVDGDGLEGVGAGGAGDALVIHDDTVDDDAAQDLGVVVRMVGEEFRIARADGIATAFHHVALEVGHHSVLAEEGGHGGCIMRVVGRELLRDEF